MDSCNIHPTAVIDERVTIGANVYIGPNCTIGFPAEYKIDFAKNNQYSVIIEDNVIITGNVTIDAGSKRNTIVGQGSFIMKSAYIAHDVILGKEVILSAHTALGGHVIVGEFANIGMGAIVHPRQTIGSYSMIGMGTVIPKKAKILPGNVYVGNPARLIGLNQVGLERHNINEAIFNKMIEDFEMMRYEY